MREARECPVCGYGFVHRRGRHCRKCGTWLLMAGERWYPAGGERAFLWLPERRAWSELKEPA